MPTYRIGLQAGMKECLSFFPPTLLCTDEFLSGHGESGRRKKRIGLLGFFGPTFGHERTLNMRAKFFFFSLHPGWMIRSFSPLGYGTRNCTYVYAVSIVVGDVLFSPCGKKFVKCHDVSPRKERDGHAAVPFESTRPRSGKFEQASPCVCHRT